MKFITAFLKSCCPFWHFRPTLPSVFIDLSFLFFPFAFVTFVVAPTKIMIVLCSATQNKTKHHNPFLDLANFESF